jgi:hypothetical protein
LHQATLEEVLKERSLGGGKRLENGRIMAEKKEEKKEK